MAADSRSRVAVVGSGMAGLVTAWLLKQDPSNRYEVEVFESGSEPSLDFASISVKNSETATVERVDVPMRAFTEGYYHNLKDMYDFLGIAYRVQPFLFSFSRIADRATSTFQTAEEKHYFVHASNNHRLPPIKPKMVGYFAFLAELVFALVCYVWFSLCCLFLPTREGVNGQACESFDQYLGRTRVPQHFVKFYLLPLISAVTTCPHKDLLLFPAKDIVDYKRCITSGRQLTVTAGVNEVQRKLTKGIKIRCSAQVTAVDSTSDGIKVRWRNVGGKDQGLVHEASFARVVLAVPPNVVATVFDPLKKQMQSMPTIPVETIVHSDGNQTARFCRSIKDATRQSWFATSEAHRAHTIHLRTTRSGGGYTEATHVQPSGVMVTSCPLSKRDPSKILSSSSFTRVLRTPESRQQVNEIFGHVRCLQYGSEKAACWKNGDNEVYLVGSWCWDGMVLLEGCVVSAMRTASALGVNIPWNKQC